MIESRVAGIPCLIKVTRYFKQKALGPGADSDWDCHGYADIEFEVCDRRGRHAPWLVRKLTAEDKNRIEIEIEEYNYDRHNVQS